MNRKQLRAKKTYERNNEKSDRKITSQFTDFTLKLIEVFIFRFKCHQVE